jgi:hypothetical protein
VLWRNLSRCHAQLKKADAAGLELSAEKYKPDICRPFVDSDCIGSCHSRNNCQALNRAEMEKVAVAFFVGENRDSTLLEGAPEMIISKRMQQLNKLTVTVLHPQTSLAIGSLPSPGLVTRYSKSGDVLPASLFPCHRFSHPRFRTELDLVN